MECVLTWSVLYTFSHVLKYYIKHICALEIWMLLVLMLRCNIFVQVDEDSDRLVTDPLQQDPDSVHDEREAPKLHKTSRNMLLNAMDSDEDE